MKEREGTMVVDTSVVVGTVGTMVADPSIVAGGEGTMVVEPSTSVEGVASALQMLRIN